MSNRHYHHRKCSFNLPNFPTQKIITGDFGCKGNGKTLGLIDGSKSYGLIATQYTTTRMYNGRAVAAFGSLVGTTGYGTGDSIATGISMGITAETNKSGIITDTSGFTSVNVCIKF